MSAGSAAVSGVPVRGIAWLPTGSGMASCSGLNLTPVVAVRARQTCEHYDNRRYDEHPRHDPPLFFSVAHCGTPPRPWRARVAGPVRGQVTCISAVGTTLGAEEAVEEQVAAASGDVDGADDTAAPE